MRISLKVLSWLPAMLALVATAISSGTQDDNVRHSPAAIVRKAVESEIAANSDSGMHFMFKNEKRTTHAAQTKLMVETREATAGLLVEVDGRPLTPEQRQTEEARLQNYVRNPEELNKKRKQEKEDAERTERIVKALPDAFIYEPDGTEQGSTSVGFPGDELVRMKFRPNPNYEPPSRVEQVLTGMDGHLLIDARQNRVAEIDGTLEKEVGFGWGILGHLDRGGRFLVQQADVGNRQWEVTRMELSFTGKILFFKKLSIRSNDTFSDFRPVPSNLTFAQGVELLEKEAARNHNGGTTDAKQQPGKQANDKVTERAEKPMCCDR